MTAYIITRNTKSRSGNKGGQSQWETEQVMA